MSETIAAGRETDARVAAALGYVVAPPHCCGAQGFGHPGDRCPGCEFEAPQGGVKWFWSSSVPHYSTNDLAALEVVEALRQRGWLVILKAMPDGLPFLAFEDSEIRVRYVASGQWMKHHTAGDVTLRVHANPTGMADTLALAVCRCALMCVAAEREAER